MSVESSTTEEGYLAGVEDAGKVAASDSDAKISDASSSADDVSEGAKQSNPPTLMDAVKAHMKKDGLDGDSPAPKKSESSEDKDPSAEAKPTKKEGGNAEGDGEEADEQPPFHKHPEWKKQVAKRKEAEALVEQYAPKAERFDQMRSMMSNNGLASDEVTAGFNIMAAMKNDPFKALELLTPYYEALQQATGNVLPEDLQSRVDAGYLTDEDARSLAQARRREAMAISRAESAERSRETQSAEVQTERIQDGVSQWEREWAAKDPDYERKLSFVHDRIRAAALQNPPKDAKAAIRMAEDALKSVNDNMKAFAPRKPAIKPPHDEAASSATASRAPRNSMEAARAALATMA